MNSKLKKHLKKEADKVFQNFVSDEEIENTKKEVEIISDCFKCYSIDAIRESKKILNAYFQDKKKLKTYTL